MGKLVGHPQIARAARPSPEYQVLVSFGRIFFTFFQAPKNCKIFDMIFMIHLGDSNNLKGDYIPSIYPKTLGLEMFGPS